MRYKFEKVKERLRSSESDDCYVSFAIAAIASDGKNNKTVAYISDVSTDEGFVDSLVDKFNRFGLEPVHLQDIVADALDS